MDEQDPSKAKSIQMEQSRVANHERVRRISRRGENFHECPEFNKGHQRRNYTAADNEAHPICRENAQETMPQKTRNRPGSGGAATNKEAAQNKEHGHRNQSDRIPSFGDGFQAIDSEPSQGKTVGKNHESCQDEPEEAERIILWVECLGEVWPILSCRAVSGTHPPRASRNHAVTASTMAKLFSKTGRRGARRKRSAPAVTEKPSNLR